MWNITGYPVKKETGEIIGVVELTMEVTRLKKAEKALRENQSLLDLILESTGDGILVGHSDGSFSYANQRFAELWNVPRSVIQTMDRAELHKIVLS